MTAAFFVLGRSSGELGLACVAVALLVGTKVTGLLSLPLLLAIALLTLRGRRLWLALAGGAAACVVGGAWFAVNLSEGEGTFGSLGEGSKGTGARRHADRRPDHALRRRRAVELPGATGRDALLYVVAAAAVAIVGVVLAAACRRDDRRRPDRAPAPRAARSSTFSTGCTGAAGSSSARTARLEWDANRDQTIASNATTWYGPVGLALAVVALVLVAARRRAGGRSRRLRRCSSPRPRSCSSGARSRSASTPGTAAT